MVSKTQEGRDDFFGNLYKWKNKERLRKVAVLPDLSKFHIQERKMEIENIHLALMEKKTIIEKL